MADKAEKKEQAKRDRAEQTKNLKVGQQYMIAIIVTLGGFVCGTGIGWSAPTSSSLTEAGYDETDRGWTSAIFAGGAAIAQFLTVALVKFLGLKWTMVVLHIIVCVSWVPMTLFVDNFWMVFIGRFINGMAGGFCVTCPTYTGEIAHKCHRGTLGVCFQLFITGGILYTFTFGVTHNVTIINIACGVWSIVAVILIVLFVPQTPQHLLRHGKAEQAAKVMVRLRGKEYDSSKEIAEMTAAINTTTSAKEGFKDKVGLKAFGVLCCLHAFQQLTGINAIMYHSHSIFEASGTKMNKDISSIIVGITQVLMCFVAAAVVDRAGRIMLFNVSLISMAVSLVGVGFFFTLKQIDADLAAKMFVLPTVALVVYVCGFSLGMGPLPWALLGEYLPDAAKAQMGMIAAFLNWALAFAIAFGMPVMMEMMDPSFIFYFFAGACGVCIVFVLMFVVETNQKTMEEIYADIARHKIGFQKKNKE